jgi:DNA-directed RNA polymerase subunit RPC12/RpoP
MRQELKAALGQPNTANRIAWEYMQFLEQIYPHKDAIVDEARKRNIKEFAKSLESLFPKKKWWQFWGKQSKLTKKDKLVEKENSPKEGANSKPYQCKNCLKTFNPGELRNGSFWNVCPYCKGDIWLVSSK